MSAAAELIEEKAASEAAKIDANPKWKGMIRQADSWIDDQLGKWKSTKKWNWSLSPTPGGEPRFSLTMTYNDATANALLTPAELSDEFVFHRQISRIWNQLLDNLMDQNQEEIQKLLGEIREERLAN